MDYVNNLNDQGWLASHPLFVHAGAAATDSLGDPTPDSVRGQCVQRSQRLTYSLPRAHSRQWDTSYSRGTVLVVPILLRFLLRFLAGPVTKSGTYSEIGALSRLHLKLPMFAPQLPTYPSPYRRRLGNGDEGGRAERPGRESGGEWLERGRMRGRPSSSCSWSQQLCRRLG